MVIVCISTNAVSKDSPSQFSHKAHLAEVSDCETCHKAKEDEQKKPATLHSACTECHDEVPAYPRKNKAVFLENAFPHQRHADALDCADCHAATLNDTSIKQVFKMTHDDCFGCHDKNDVEIIPSNCASCHGVAAQHIKPQSHGKDVVFRHGTEAKWRISLGHGRDCYACHQKNECTKCHLTQRPRDHTGLWRLRTHGIAASWDRSRCKTCHGPGICIACHQKTKPINHRGAWKTLHGLSVQNRQDRRCGVCHASSWCAQCHRRK